MQIPCKWHEEENRCYEAHVPTFEGCTVRTTILVVGFRNSVVVSSLIFKDDKLLSSDFKVDWLSEIVKAVNLTISLCTPDNINDDRDGGEAGDDDDNGDGNGDAVDEADSGGGVDVTGDKDGCDDDVDDSNGTCKARWDVETDW